MIKSQSIMAVNLNSQFSYQYYYCKSCLSLPFEFCSEFFWFRSEFLKTSVYICFCWQEKAIASEFLRNFFRKKADDRGIAYCRQNLDSVKSYAKQTKLILNPLAFFIRTFMKPYKNKTYRPAFYTEASLTLANSS